jgi:hypothetical protein
MAFGTGSAIAHRAVGAVAGAIGGSSSEAAAPAAAAAPSTDKSAADCSSYQRDFTRCLKEVWLSPCCNTPSTIRIHHVFLLLNSFAEQERHRFVPDVHGLV